ncbi:MAG TPA: hypothetical protein EYN06_06345 [Myxococcales bacterium]|nr:hypothetical protein [Myxococcales bacterium]HIN86083.1 hypothetical protein [Myxococcales bacterium]
MKKIPVRIAHYGRFDPRVSTGGVETFARNLGIVFEEVDFITPETLDVTKERDAGTVIICDNQMTIDWPEDFPVIGFQHGVAAVKKTVTKSRIDKKLAKQQEQAASRPNTLWVACARWISHKFNELYNNPADHVVYHQVDVDRFDGKLENDGSRLILHDGRSKHKGSKQFKQLVKAFPEWNFESLNCKPEDVPERFKKGAAFMHLSRYEGNSIVCNEAMAMNLPCMFTKVGLMNDGEDLDIHMVDADAVFGSKGQLIKEAGAFLDSLASRTYEPRRWTMQNATPSVHIAAWATVLRDFNSRYNFGLTL